MRLPKDCHNSEFVWRAKFSSLAKSDLYNALKYLYKPDKNISDSVEARQILDLKVGCSFTRFQTNYWKKK